MMLENEQITGDPERPFSYDFGAFGEDIDLLCGLSLRLRAHFAMLRRNAWRGGLSGAMRQRTADLIDTVRASYRVAIDLRGRSRWPLSEHEAIAWMRAPRMVRTGLFRELQREESRVGADPRLLFTVDRMIRDAARIDVPLWPSRLHVARAELVAEFVTGASDELPSESAFGTGDAVRISHCTDELLPWSAWDAIDAMALRASEATGFRLAKLGKVPGEYRLADEAPEWAPRGSRLRPAKLLAGEQRDEVVRLLGWYSGGRWHDEVPEP